LKKGSDLQEISTKNKTISDTQIPKELFEIEESQLLFGKYLLLRRGKKNYHLLVFADNPKESQIVNLSQPIIDGE